MERAFCVCFPRAWFTFLCPKLVRWGVLGEVLIQGTARDHPQWQQPFQTGFVGLGATPELGGRVHVQVAGAARERCVHTKGFREKEGWLVGVRSGDASLP